MTKEKESFVDANLFSPVMVLPVLWLA